MTWSRPLFFGIIFGSIFGPNSGISQFMLENFKYFLNIFFVSFSLKKSFSLRRGSMNMTFYLLKAKMRCMF